MLQSLALRDFVIVDHLELDFGSGFSVLTGETGAGKSILLDALALALGERADTSQIREGCQRAEIAAIFQVEEDLQDEIAAWLGEADFPLEDDHRIVIKRSIDHSGRSKAYINGSAASLNQLRELGDRLVDIHGQHAHQLLLKTGAQRELLDQHANLHDQAAIVAQAYQSMNATAKQLQQAEAAGADLQREQERLQWQLDELNEIAPQAHEWEEIQTAHARLANAAKIIQGIELAIDSLSDSEQSIESQLHRVQHAIDDLVRHDPNLNEINESLRNAQIQIDEAIHGLNRYRQKMDLDPDRLAELEARMQALHTAARKYKVNPEQLPELWISSQEKLAAFTAAQDIESLRQKFKVQESEFLKLARDLSKRRHQAAAELSQAVSDAMQHLAMAGGKLQVLVGPSEASRHGIDQIEFLIAAHSGSTPKPLAKVASGGELARISLAISVITSKASFTPTLIFDEVDSGIGGAVAQTVGELLKQLGHSHQILCVTHLAQVAAQGDHHFKVSKQALDGKTNSEVRSLGRQERIEEIARMLGGTTITDTTRRHARELLNQT
ncbi:MULTISPECIES: DNA repair protein RecN [unclassified Polynucleobacter]|uniref:DNA repair protein RecN n=1 Tax=unclassified Polynucleobacter TaxID=2640945 RepID=UPI002573139F|nr:MULTISPECIES: DNA repair protein RecN [unclassified Polynucleobacter]BEI43294.1 DNA repair protein RecN [Polynucleobacter sp. HIN10]BEI45070.1 DNA repair protein RecN [Polynucleobacter sp. HIN11]